MTDEDRIEILSQALWMKHFGVTQVRPEWTAFANSNQDQANELRQKAKTMIEAARPHKTHSLGWLP
jgi:hypothetical protein